jgi:GTP-binding protein Era
MSPLLRHASCKFSFSGHAGVVSQVGWHGMGHATRVKSAWHAAADADVALFLVDAHRQVEAPDPRVALLISNAAEHLMPPVVGGDAQSRAAPRSVLVLNKADALRPAGKRLHLLRGLLNDLAPLHSFDAMFAVSSLKHHGCGALVKQLLAWAQPVPWPLPPDRAADRGPVAQALAATQGALFERLHEELPYTISLRHVSWTEFRDGSVRVEQTLLVPTQAVRKIVVGKDGASIGQIGIAARKVCEEMFGRRVHLILNVKVARGRRASSAEGPDSVVDTFEDDGEGE